MIHLLLLLMTAVGPTWTESHDFRSTPSYGETLDYLRYLQTALPDMHVTTFGKSAQGRDMPLVIVSKDRAFTPEAAAATGKPIVLIQNGIHAGEIDGKDACLLILRDMAQGKGKEILDHLILLIIPVYNVDGHERVSPHWRPAQNGPVDGMGFRANAAGLDLNRDHLKLDSPEARQVVTLFNRWHPHLHVDNHVTNGAHHDWVLTYAYVKEPQAPTPLARYADDLIRAVVRAVRERGHPIGPYVDLLDHSDPSKGFSSYVGRPWYATGYYPLRNVPSILVENHAPKPYRDRVLANQAFLEEVLRYVAAHPRETADQVRASAEFTARAGSADAPPSAITQAWERDESDPRTIQYPGRDWNLEDSTVSGGKVLQYDDTVPQPMEVPWVYKAKAAKSASRPLGYLVLPGWPVIEERLELHGLRFRRLGRPAELPVETLRITNPRYAPNSYQGHIRVQYGVEVRRESRTLPAGTIWIPADQPDFEVAVQLLEPESPDSLAAWGMLASVVENKEYISLPVLEPKARKMLEDSAVRAEWEKALQDDAFAADPQSRFLWWYARTPYWDDEVGMLPVMRLPREATPAGTASNRKAIDSVPRP